MCCMGRITSCLFLALVALACTKKEAATEPERPAEKATAEKPSDKAEKPPNFIIVLLDDTGYADFGAYGSEINTPNIDRLAANGVQFSNYHTPATCSPTRSMLLTGVDNHLTGMGNMIEIMADNQFDQPGY